MATKAKASDTKAFQTFHNLADKAEVHRIRLPGVCGGCLATVSGWVSQAAGLPACSQNCPIPLHNEVELRDNTLLLAPLRIQTCLYWLIHRLGGLGCLLLAHKIKKAPARPHFAAHYRHAPCIYLKRLKSSVMAAWRARSGHVCVAYCCTRCRRPSRCHGHDQAVTLQYGGADRGCEGTWAIRMSVSSTSKRRGRPPACTPAASPIQPVPHRRCPRLLLANRHASPRRDGTWLPQLRR